MIIRDLIGQRPAATPAFKTEGRHPLTYGQLLALIGATEGELRDFAGSKLADFKVPRRILIVREIPKGATGKLQRMGLAQKLGLVR